MKVVCFGSIGADLFYRRISDDVALRTKACEQHADLEPEVPFYRIDVPDVKATVGGDVGSSKSLFSSSSVL